MRRSGRQRCSPLPFKVPCEERLRNEVLEEMQMQPGHCCMLGDYWVRGLQN